MSKIKWTDEESDTHEVKFGFDEVEQPPEETPDRTESESSKIKWTNEESNTHKVEFGLDEVKQPPEEISDE